MKNVEMSVANRIITNKNTNEKCVICFGYVFSNPKMKDARADNCA